MKVTNKINYLKLERNDFNCINNMLSFWVVFNFTYAVVMINSLKGSESAHFLHGSLIHDKRTPTYLGKLVPIGVVLKCHISKN